jgi:hypothetical protein
MPTGRQRRWSPGPSRHEAGGGVAVTLLGLGAAFLAFIALIGAVHAVDSWSLQRFGYAPFALVNVLIMLLPSGALLAGLAILGGAETGGPDLGALGLDRLALLLDPLWLCSLAACAAVAMAWLIGRRTNAWVALFSAPLLLFGAPVLVFSILFRTLAAAGPTGG